MGVTKDFITATIADAMTPTFRRPMEDLIYETLDRRQIPTRTDFKELRDLVNNLRGQVSGSIQSVRALNEQIEEIEENLETQSSETNIPEEQEEIGKQLIPIHKLLDTLQESIAQLEKQTLTARILSLEEHMQEQSTLLARIEVLETNQHALKEAQNKKETHSSECIVSGCMHDVRSRGFCTNHYKKFRRGTLDLFVNKDGICKIGKHRYQLPIALEGSSYTISDGTLIVGEQEFLISDLKEATKDS